MQKAKSSSGQAAAAALAPESSVEFVLSQAETPEKFSAALAKLFAVRLTEVALMRLEKGLLRFLCPSELKTAGSIPVSSSTAVAAHTAVTKKVEMFNSFVKVKHASVFETVRLTNPEDTDQAEQATIQKLMSAPILDAQRKVVGVVQICRKGYDQQSSGPDFTLDDLQQLEFTTKVLAKMPFMKGPGA
jgi:hypothetical protein